MKKLLLALGILLSMQGIAQDKVKTREGNITFEASVPSFEEVKAKHENVTAILNTETGEFASLVLVKGFRFKIALMEEHFNENYVESDTYPKAIVKGKISNFDATKLNSEAKEHTLEGTMEMHGKTNAIQIPIEITKEGNRYTIRSSFAINPEDYDIKIPSIVRKKLAKEVNVSVDFTLE